MVLTLLEKEHLVDNVWAFRFTPSEPLLGIAGQFVRVELLHSNPDEEGTKRWFTNSAAPYEGILQITTRVTGSSFKRALSELEVGSTALQLIDKPDGDFVWQDSEAPLLFVAGGIGITPFRSILRQRVHDGQAIAVTLLYGGHTPELPFREELERYAQDHSDFILRYSNNQPLTIEVLREQVPLLAKSLVYISGPEPLVESLGDELKQQGLADSQLKQDFFPHYTSND